MRTRASIEGPSFVRLANPPPPETIAARLSRARYPFFLDSSAEDARLGRFSFLGCDPFLVMRAKGRSVQLGDGISWRQLSNDPLDSLQDLLAAYTMPQGDLPFPFIGGAVGYLSYDLGRLIERMPSKALDNQTGIPDLSVAFYDAIIAYDHQAGTTYLVSTGLPNPPGEKRYAHAQRRLAWLEALAADALPLPPHNAMGLTATRGGHLHLQSNFTKDAYLLAVERARQYIIAGDIYQVNLSQRFQCPWAGTPWELYEDLRRRNPAPFAAYLGHAGTAIISSSPERFLRLSGDTLETRPIKGTRPRGVSPALDAALAHELMGSIKDQAEHIMIVDLERSDLGRVAQVGTVSVDEFMALERYATVLHLTSTIRGVLRKDRGLAQILRATFPGGSITGAPKVRAMEIIEELEPTRRGVYTGAIGYFSASGDFDLNIAIRTIVVDKGVASFHVGGGIVFDSTPEAEYQETLDKGIALAKALGGTWPEFRSGNRLAAH